MVSLAVTEERFWQKVDKDGPGGCWIWTASKTAGYGQFTWHENGKRAGYRAHRYSYQLHNGPIPDGLCVCHHCDNPLCVNPAHMFLGTHQDNMADMVAKGRVGRAAKLNPEIVSMIREEVDSGRSTRDEMARKFGVTKTAIGLICRRETWRHVKDENTSGWVRRWYGNSKLTPDIVREIRTEVDSGRATRTNMARKFSVSLETIGIICSRRSWRNVA